MLAERIFTTEAGGSVYLARAENNGRAFVKVELDWAKVDTWLTEKDCAQLATALLSIFQTTKYDGPINAGTRQCMTCGAAGGARHSATCANRFRPAYSPPTT